MAGPFPHLRRAIPEGSMRFLFFILLILLIAHIGFWHTLGAVLGAALMFVILIPLIIAVVVVGGILVLAGVR
jgi:hypothetical protein